MHRRTPATPRARASSQPPPHGGIRSKHRAPPPTQPPTQPRRVSAGPDRCTSKSTPQDRRAARSQKSARPAWLEDVRSPDSRTCAQETGAPVHATSPPPVPPLSARPRQLGKKTAAAGGPKCTIPRKRPHRRCDGRAPSQEPHMPAARVRTPFAPKRARPLGGHHKRSGLRSRHTPVQPQAPPTSPRGAPDNGPTGPSHTPPARPACPTHPPLHNAPCPQSALPTAPSPTPTHRQAPSSPTAERSGNGYFHSVYMRRHPWSG